jgi:hypothetical protein
MRIMTSGTNWPEADIAHSTARWKGHARSAGEGFMAVWHFKFSLIPTEGLLRVFGETNVSVIPEFVSNPEGPRNLEPEELERLPSYWDGPAKLRQIAMAVSVILPEMKSWSSEARMFGSDEQDRVEVWNDHVNCRINMRAVDFALLDKLLHLAKRFDCKLVIHGTGAIAAPDVASLAPHVECSNAYKFCLDPIGFLAALKPSSAGRDE